MEGMVADPTVEVPKCHCGAAPEQTLLWDDRFAMKCPDPTCAYGQPMTEWFRFASSAEAAWIKLMRERRSGRLR